MTVTLTIPDTNVPALATILRPRGVAGVTDAAVVQAFFDAQAAAEVRAVKIQDAQATLATETGKGGGADAATLKDLLYAEYQARVS
jgi:aconitase B